VGAPAQNAGFTAVNRLYLSAVNQFKYQTRGEDMSILDSRKNNFMHVFSRIFKAAGVILAMWCVLSAEAVAGCGFVDVRSFITSPNSKFIDGGYTGFSTLVGKTVADCYASTLQENGKLGKELLSTLNADNSTAEINEMRGLGPAIKLLVAHRGGPDWANGIPDNSVAAFQQSIKRGVSSVEVDLQIDKNRNLIAFHDESFADMVRSDDIFLSAYSHQAIKDREWITRSETTRKLDESNLLKLRRVIPNSFSDNGLDYNSNSVLRVSTTASLADSSVVVSSLHKALSEIQTASNTQFKSKTAVNIFLDAAKSRDITIATINRLRKSYLIAKDQMFNDIDSSLAVPDIKSIAVQFRINHFPGGADDLAEALCSSAENKIIYKKSVVKTRVKIPKGNYFMFKNETKISYSDSTDNFSNSYGQSVTYGLPYLYYQHLSTEKYYDNGNPPLQLWGDASSGSCNTNDILNSGIALIPVIEEKLPYKVTLDTNGNPRNLYYPNDFALGIMDFLKPFKKYFKMNIIEFSYTPMDKVSYYSADAKQVVDTNTLSEIVYRAIATKATDSVFIGQQYIFQTFNRFFDINFINASDSKYNGPYLCSTQLVDSVSGYIYACNKQKMGSTDEQKFEYRAKPGFYTGVCNTFMGTPFRALPFGLTTTDNPLLEIYLNGIDFIGDHSLERDFCSTTNEGNRMSEYTTRYKSFVGNPSFRLSGGI